MSPMDIGSIAGASVAALVSAWAYFKKVRPHVRRRASVSGVERNARIFVDTSHQIRRWRAEFGSMRVLCLSARNGGSPWNPEQPLYVSCLDQSPAENVPNTHKRWQDWECDPPYREFLMTVLHAGKRGVLLVTDHMQEGTLRDAYEEAGTVASLVFPICWVADSNALVYVSINFGEPRHDGKPLTKLEKSKHESTATNLFHRAELVRSMATLGEHMWISRR